MAPISAAKEHRTVSRVTTILEIVGAEPHGVRLQPLAAALGAPKSSVHGLVKGLVATGYLREDGGAYVLGPAIGALLAPSRPTLVEVARPGMERLNGQLDETVMLATLVGDSVVYIDSLESTQLIRYSPPLRRRRPAYPTSAGKCLLAHAGSRRRAVYLERHEPDGSRRAAIGEELDRVREEGVAFNRGETVPDISAAASPIRLGPRVIACLAVAGPSSRMGGRLDEAARAVRQAASDISRRLA